MIGEGALAAGAGLMLARGRPALRPEFGSSLCIGLAGAGAGSAGSRRAPVDCGRAVAGVLFVGAVFVLRAVPLELVGALRRASVPPVGCSALSSVCGSR